MPSQDPRLSVVRLRAILGTGDEDTGDRMWVRVKGVSLFFDVEGAGLVPDGPRMREKPTLVLLTGPQESWTLAQWGDDVRAFCDALGIERPIASAGPKSARWPAADSSTATRSKRSTRRSR